MQGSKYSVSTNKPDSMTFVYLLNIWTVTVHNYSSFFHINSLHADIGIIMGWHSVVHSGFFLDTLYMCVTNVNHNIVEIYTLHNSCVYHIRFAFFKMEITTTNRGKPCLILENYRFKCARVTKTTKEWRCTTDRFKARCTTDLDTTIVIHSSTCHNHSSMTAEDKENHKIRQFCKRKATDDISARPNGRGKNKTDQTGMVCQTFDISSWTNKVLMSKNCGPKTSGLKTCFFTITISQMWAENELSRQTSLDWGKPFLSYLNNEWWHSDLRSPSPSHRLPKEEEKRLIAFSPFALWLAKRVSMSLN